MGDTFDLAEAMAQDDEQAEEAAVGRAAPPRGGERAGAGGALAKVAHRSAKGGAEEHGQRETQDG